MTGLAGGAALGAGFGGYGFGFEPRFRLVATGWDLPTSKWPYAKPLRIVALADIHACDPWMPVERIAAIVEQANALSGDVVLLLGDFVAGLSHFKTANVPMREWSAVLAGLKAPLGAHAVLGNHDWWTDAEGVTRALTAAGVSVYRNRAAKLGGETPFWLAGTDSMLARRLGQGRFEGKDDLPGTLRQIQDDAPAVLMAHEPDLFVDVPDRFTATLSGHTHGGQVFVPVLGRPVVPSAYGQRFAYGHVHEGGRDLIVSGGLGCSVLPVRFGVPPEITVVTLRSATASA
jgi:predicted MPP superfamily phosphohydrolase